MRNRRRAAVLAAFLVGLALVTAPAPARARSAAAEAGLGAGCAFGNLLYGPGKLTYAIFGGFIGLIAYGLSAGDEDVAMRVIEPAWRGDYALTLEHLTGERELEFIGRRGEHRNVRGEDSDDSDDSDEPAGGDTGWE